MGGTPKDTLDKIESLVASVPMEDQEVCEFMREWGRCSCVAMGPVGAKVNQSSSIAAAWRDFPCGTKHNHMAGPKEGSMWSAMSPICSLLLAP
jgi:hypothetical protein